MKDYLEKKLNGSTLVKLLKGYSLDMQKRARKGGNKTEVNGHIFDSAIEAKRYVELKSMLLGGYITDLHIHPCWGLHVCGIEIGTYSADFAYKDIKGNKVYEDVKSKSASKIMKRSGLRALKRNFHNELYLWKKKHMKAEYGIDIVEYFL